MLRGKLIAQASCLCIASWLFAACDSDPAFDVNEEDAQAGIDGQGQAQSDLDATAQGGQGVPGTGCTTDEGTPCSQQGNLNNTDDGSTDADDAGSDGNGSTDGGSTAGTTTSGTTGGDTTGGSTTSGTTTSGTTTSGTTTSGTTTSGTTTSGGTDGSTTSGTTDGGMTLQGKNETFVVEGEEKPVDLVLTVDNSGSMYEEQVGLADRIVSAFSHIQGADFRVALMSTDTSQGIQHFVDSASPGTFQEKMDGLKTAIQALGTNGSGNERGYKQSVVGLTADNPEQPGDQSWLRTGSVVAALIVSDEDNCSTGCGSENTAWMTGELTALGRTPGDDARIYGLIRRNAGECTSAAYVGTQYMEGISQTNGIAGAICDTDYGPTLQQISADIGVIANTTFELQHAPYPGTLQAWINGVQYSGNVEIDGNRVSLTDASLSPEDEVYIQYSYLVP